MGKELAAADFPDRPRSAEEMILSLLYYVDREFGSRAKVRKGDLKRVKASLNVEDIGHSQLTSLNKELGSLRDHFMSIIEVWENLRGIGEDLMQYLERTQNRQRTPKLYEKGRGWRRSSSSLSSIGSIRPSPISSSSNLPSIWGKSEEEESVPRKIMSLMGKLIHSQEVAGYEARHLLDDSRDLRDKVCCRASPQLVTWRFLGLTEYSCGR
jgi:hypothetical protein